MDRAAFLKGAAAGAVGLELVMAGDVYRSETAQAAQPNILLITPICGPARGSVLTGKWSHNTGLEATSGAWDDLVKSGELALNIARRLEAVG